MGLFEDEVEAGYRLVVQHQLTRQCFWSLLTSQRRAQLMAARLAAFDASRTEREASQQRATRKARRWLKQRQAEQAEAHDRSEWERLKAKYADELDR